LLLANFLLLLASLLAVFVAVVRAWVADGEGGRAGKRLADREACIAEDEALAAIGLMTGDLCEEIVAPVTVILAQCELLRSAGEEESPRLRAIESQARRIARAVERHRGFAPSTSATGRAVDLPAIAREAVQELAPLAYEAGVALHPLFDDVPPVSANPLLLKRALRQLIRNAVAAASRRMHGRCDRGRGGAGRRRRVLCRGRRTRHGRAPAQPRASAAHRRPCGAARNGCRRIRHRPGYRCGDGRDARARQRAGGWNARDTSASGRRGKD